MFDNDKMKIIFPIEYLQKIPIFENATNILEIIHSRLKEWVFFASDCINDQFHIGNNTKLSVEKNIGIKLLYFIFFIYQVWKDVLGKEQWMDKINLCELLFIFFKEQSISTNESFFKILKNIRLIF